MTFLSAALGLIATARAQDDAEPAVLAPAELSDKDGVAGDSFLDTSDSNTTTELGEPISTEQRRENIEAAISAWDSKQSAEDLSQDVSQKGNIVLGSGTGIGASLGFLSGSPVILAAGASVGLGLSLIFVAPYYRTDLVVENIEAQKQRLLSHYEHLLPAKK